jgi:hypothetical protein
MRIFCPDQIADQAGMANLQQKTTLASNYRATFFGKFKLGLRPVGKLDLRQVGGSAATVVESDASRHPDNSDHQGWMHAAGCWDGDVAWVTEHSQPTALTQFGPDIVSESRAFHGKIAAGHVGFRLIEFAAENVATRDCFWV